MSAASLPPTSLMPSARWRALRRWGANAVILIWLIVAAHQAVSLIPDRLAESLGIDALARCLGIWQHRWSMFAPEPDSQNQAIEAVVTFADGTTAVWHTPDWRSIHPLQRFVQPREAKFLESLEGTMWSAAWPAFARDIAAELQRHEPGRPAPKRVELYLEILRIDSPDERWQSWNEPLAVTERHLFHVEELP